MNTMSEKHTPGPWTVDLSDDRFLVRDDEENIVADCWNGVFGDDGEYPLDTCGPNARLIAAAPDLLAAARLVRDNNRKGVTGSEARKGWQALNEALSKAGAQS
jgi:hypothetical protein